MNWITWPYSYNMDMSARNPKSICVVGAGVIGLSTAVNIIDNIPHVNVTIIADKFSPNTTGDVAAGFWFPHAIGDTPEELVMKWGRRTWDHLSNLVNSPEAKEAGVQMLSGYQLYKSSEPNRKYVDIFPRCVDMTSKEMSLVGGQYSQGLFTTSIVCQFLIYSSWLMKRFLTKGGKILKRSLTTLVEIYKNYDVIVNCSGLGANKLVNDISVCPILGQVLRVHAPWVKHFYISKDDYLHIFPCRDYVLLGASSHMGDWTTQPKEADSKRIWEGCCKLLPSLKGAKILGHDVGLRPGRHAVRLETEIIDYNGHKKFVVHNYGHGGAGITFHWGSAVEATQLVRDCLGMARL